MGDQSARSPPRVGGGRFYIVDQLGDGGTATVYLAWDSRERQWCALKALLFRHLRDEEIRRRFGLEAAALNALRHPNIPRLVAFDPDASPPYLAMELARCGSAMDWIRKNGPMPPSMAADVMFQVCEALAAVHALGMVHRDVKPHNFLLDDQGVCKLTDFGIARATERTSLTITGSQIGTFSFMAPEQRTDTKSVDWRADIYAVGASVYTLLTGRLSAELFVGEKDEEMLAEVPGALRHVVLKATRYHPEDRYASIVELQTELMESLSRLSPSAAGHPPLVTPPEPLPVGPPRQLPVGRRFDDLEQSLALDANQPTFMPVDPRIVDGGPPAKRVMPYFMPERPQLRVRTVSEPVYAGADEDDVAGYIERGPPPAPPTPAPAHRSDSGAAPEPSLSATAQTGPTAPTEPDAEPDDLRLLRWLAAAVVVVMVAAGAVIGAVGVGVYQVHGARLTAIAASEALTETVQAEGSVVYELQADRTAFEAIYQRFDQAGDARTRIDAALAFVDAVDHSVGELSPGAEDGRTLPPSIAPRVRRLHAAGAAYRSAISGWGRAANRFPGSAAVFIGVASPPDV